MSGHIKLLVGGVLLGGALLILVVWRGQHLDNRLSDARTACEETKANKTSFFEDYLLCDPVELASSKRPDPPGVQGELARVQRQRTQWYRLEDSLTGIAFLIIVVAAMPWAWYFLLDRLGELKDALTGGPTKR